MHGTVQFGDQFANSPSLERCDCTIALLVDIDLWSVLLYRTVYMFKQVCCDLQGVCLVLRSAFPVQSVFR